MANLFGKSANELPPKMVVGILIIGILTVAGIAYYFTPKYTRVGYMPKQPIPFDHSLHVTGLGLDCRFCHSFVEKSGFSNIPTTQTCMACHRMVKADSPKLAELRESWESGEPVRWARVYQLPDYVYFDHSAHVNRGVSCFSCHGEVNLMRTVYHKTPLSMSWCLDCHRNPEYFLRPQEKVFDPSWVAPDGPQQVKMGKEMIEREKIKPSDNCSACHR